MMPISGMNTGAVQPLTTAGKVLGASKVQKTEEESQDRQPKPVMDEYVPEEPQEPSGRYWMGKDEDGRPKIYFDGPEEKKVEDEVWECNTDKVDREIEKLKKEQQELEQRLNTETDGTKIKALERQLVQVKQALKQKDNDTYRKQNATFTQLS